MIYAHLILMVFFLLILQEHFKTKPETISRNPNEWILLAFTENCVRFKSVGTSLDANGSRFYKKTHYFLCFDFH